MFVITAIVGNSFRNDRSLSSASATISSPRPSRALLPNALSRPPMTAVGSRPARSSTSAIIDVVVVFPCAPATAMANRRRINSASISARGITGMCRRTASATSGFDGFTADDVTTTSASPTCAAAWPTEMVMPSVASRSVIEDRFSSEPLTAYPRLASNSAVPLSRMPPMPMKCTRLVSPSNRHLDKIAQFGMRHLESRMRTFIFEPFDVAYEFQIPNSEFLIACLNEFQRPIHDHFGRVGPCQRASGAAHPLPPIGIGRQGQNPFGQRGPGRVRLQQHLGAPRSGERFGILALMVVGRSRQRNQNRRLARRRDLGKRRGAG